METLTHCANRHDRECEKYVKGWGTCMQHKCKNDINTIACIPNREYDKYVEQICIGDMPWATVDLSD